MNCPRGKRNARGAAKQASEIQSTDKSLERQNNLNSQEKPETSQGGKRVGSTYQSPECLEHSVCTTNSGTGKATLRPIDAFLSSRPGVGVERVAEVLKGGQSKDHGLSPYENMSHCMGLPCMSDRRPLSSFLMKDVYAHLGRPFSPTAAPIPTYPATPSLRIHTAFCHEEHAHCPPCEQPGGRAEQGFLEWVPENAIWKTGLSAHPTH